MAQATDVSSISQSCCKNPSSSRRTFLAPAAGSVAFMASAAPAMSATDNPIFAATEIHRSAVTAFRSKVKLHCELERTLPSDKRRSNIDLVRRQAI